MRNAGLPAYLKSYPFRNFSMTSSFCAAELLPLRFTTPQEVIPAWTSRCCSQSSVCEEVVAARLLKLLTSVEHECHWPAENLRILQVRTVSINSAQHHLHLHASCCEGYQEPQVLVHDTVSKRILWGRLYWYPSTWRDPTAKKRPKVIQTW